MWSLRKPMRQDLNAIVVEITWKTHLVFRNANHLHLPLILVEELSFGLTIRSYQTEHSNLAYCLTIPFFVFTACQTNLELSNTEQDQWDWRAMGQSNTENVLMEWFTWAIQLFPLCESTQRYLGSFTHPPRQCLIQPSKLSFQCTQEDHMPAWAPTALRQVTSF